MLRINADRVDLDILLISQRILHPLHYVGHDGTNTRAAGKEKVYNRNLPFHLITPYNRAIWSNERKVRHIMLLHMNIAANSNGLLYTLITSDRDLVIVLATTPQKNNYYCRYQ